MVRNERLNMTNRQLEMSFGNARLCRRTSRRQRRLSSAKWWFDRMRQVVNEATEWRPAPAARPEQIWFPNSYRLVSASSPNSEQQHFVE